MMLPTLFTDHLRLRPIDDPAPMQDGLTALILVVEDMETEPLVHFADEIYERRHGQWYGELTGAKLPRGATWYLPERAICAVPQAVVARRVAPVSDEAQAPVGTLPPAVLALFEERN